MELTIYLLGLGGEMESATLFLWIGYTESEKTIEDLTEWQYIEDENDYKSWFEKSFHVDEYDQSFRSIGVKNRGESIYQVIENTSYGSQFVTKAIEDINSLLPKEALDNVNVIFSTINVKYDKKIREANIQGLRLIYVNSYEIQW